MGDGGCANKLGAVRRAVHHVYLHSQTVGAQRFTANNSLCAQLWLAGERDNLLDRREVFLLGRCAVRHRVFFSYLCDSRYCGWRNLRSGGGHIPCKFHKDQLADAGPAKTLVRFPLGGLLFLRLPLRPQVNYALAHLAPNSNDVSRETVSN